MAKRATALNLLNDRKDYITHPCLWCGWALTRSFSRVTGYGFGGLNLFYDISTVMLPHMIYMKGNKI